MARMLGGQPIHADVTIDRAIGLAMENETYCGNDGLCVACGSEVGGCDPDTRQGLCDCCGRPAVYGAEELCLMLG